MSLQRPDAVPVKQEVTGGRLIRNTIINGLANSIGALLTIALTPFFLHRLGTAQYGIWLLALTLTFSSGYVVLADLGLQEAVVRFVAEARARDATEVISRVASSTLAVFLAVGIVAAVVVVLVAPLLVHLFHVPQGLENNARVIFSLVAASILVELPTAAFLSVIEGAQRYGWLRVIDVGQRIGWAAFSIGAVLAGGGVLWLAVALLASTVGQAVVAVVVAHHVQPGLAVRPGMVDRATLRRMFGYGWLVSILRVASVVYAQMDRAIVGIALGVTSVARYEVVNRIEAGATFALVTASSSVLPASAYNVARTDTERQREMYVRGSRYAVAFAAPITLSAILYARPLIDTWVGRSYGDLAATAQLFLAYPLFWCLHVVGINMLVGHGRIGRLATVQTAAVVVNLALSIALVRPMGIGGVVAGTVIAGALAFVPYLHLLLSTFGCTLQEWLRSVVAPNLPGAAAQVGFGLLTLDVVERIADFWVVVAFCVASCAVSAVVFLFAGIRTVERRTLARQLRGG